MAGRRGEKDQNHTNLYLYLWQRANGPFFFFFFAHNAVAKIIQKINQHGSKRGVVKPRDPSLANTSMSRKLCYYICGQIVVIIPSNLDGKRLFYIFIELLFNNLISIGAATKY